MAGEAFTNDLATIIGQVNPDALGVDLPVAGKVYHVSAPTAAAWLRLNLKARLAETSAAAAAAADEAFGTGDFDIQAHLVVPSLAELTQAAEEGASFHEDILGRTLHEAIEDDLPFPLIDVMAQAVWLHFFFADGPRIARMFWECGGDLGKLSPSPGTASPSAPRATGTRTRTAAASTTQTRASRTGTTSRKRKRKH